MAAGWQKNEPTAIARRCDVIVNLSDGVTPASRSLWSGYSLLHLLAHEVGHIIFNTAEHVDTGIMSRNGDNWTPTPEDLALSCRTIQRACN